jgi:transcriptional regulator with XRE-family HTH domain
MNYKSKSQVIKRIRERTQPENKIFVQKNVAISNQISEYLNSREWTQKEFAAKLGKHESEVSKILSGLHNITLKSIAKMEAVLGEEIVLTPIEACKKYASVKYVFLEEKATSNKIIAFPRKNFAANVNYQNTKEEKVA